jgi:hypothetical protein
MLSVYKKKIRLAIKIRQTAYEGGEWLIIRGELMDIYYFPKSIFGVFYAKIAPTPAHLPNDLGSRGCPRVYV